MIFSERHQQAVNLLASAYSTDFAEYLSKNDKMIELVNELAENYVNLNIPIVDVDASYELCLALSEKVDILSCD